MPEGSEVEGGINDSSGTTTAADPSAASWSRVRRRVGIWLVFTVFVGILPVIAGFVKSGLATSKWDWTGATENGELLLLTTAITGAAMGEQMIALVFTTRSEYREYRFWLILSCVLLLAAALVFYLVISKDAQGNVLNAKLVSVASDAIFGIGIAVVAQAVVVGGIVDG